MRTDGFDVGERVNFDVGERTLCGEVVGNPGGGLLYFLFGKEF